jgi:hypothetical protein
MLSLLEINQWNFMLHSTTTFLRYVELQSKIISEICQATPFHKCCVLYGKWQWILSGHSQKPCEAHIKIAGGKPSVCRSEASQELLIWDFKNWQWWVVTPFVRPFIIFVFRLDGFNDYFTWRPICICVHSYTSTYRQMCWSICNKNKVIHILCNSYFKI